jgi:hypothetical protein
MAAPDVERITGGERAAGWAGLGVALVLGLICLDLALGGKLSGFLARREPCPGGCGE